MRKSMHLIFRDAAPCCVEKKKQKIVSELQGECPDYLAS